MRSNLLMLACIASLAFGGCGEIPKSTGQNYKIRAITDDNQARLVLAVAHARSSLDLVDGRMLWRGVYGGESLDGCARVRLNLVRHPEHKLHYLVCDRDVREIMDVAPEPGRDTQIVAVLTSLSRAAWRTNQVQKAPFNGYELEAEPVGPASINGCRLIEQRMLYEDMVVDIREERVCQ